MLLVTTTYKIKDANAEELSLKEHIIKMKPSVGVSALLFLLCVGNSVVAGSPFWEKLFGGYDNTNYYNRPRSYGRSYGSDNGDRYRSICRVHSVNTLAFPGQVGNPVCP